jgi:hypothetical protein
VSVTGDAERPLQAIYFTPPAPTGPCRSIARRHRAVAWTASDKMTRQAKNLHRESPLV